jgi:hypothetical protein
MTRHTCRYGDEITVTPCYIEYRNRLIDSSAIGDFCVRGKKFLVNSYKQNTSLPTLCVHMVSHDEALHLYDTLIQNLYSEDEEEKTFSTSKKEFLDWLFSSD